MKQFRSFVLGALLLGATGLVVAAPVPMPEPYCSIADLPFDPHHFFDNGRQLEVCLKECKAQTVIEVGSWLGGSTRFMAARLPSGGKLYAVDTWAGSEEHQSDSRIPYLYQQFLSNVKHAKLTHTIVPIRLASLQAAKALNVKADLIYIDAAHDAENVYKDIMAWYPHLKEGGIFCGDDWYVSATVREGVTRAATDLGLQIASDTNFWRFK
jgi:predicted O-methyltransferase YrrM